MKLIIVPLLILLIATQAFSKWVLLMEYEWNKEYIAQNLCDNRNRPQLNCEGKCELAKKMVEEEKGPSSQNPNPKLKFQELIFASESLNMPINLSTGALSALFDVYLLKLYPAPVFSIFHPPA